MERFGNPSTTDKNFEKQIKAFLEAIGAPPPENEIIMHPTLTREVMGEDGKMKEVPVEFIPVSFVESKLDYFFNGLWQTTNFQYTIGEQKSEGGLELSIWHPEANVWLTRTGAATIVGDLGILKTECVKNAAKSFGGIFGRGLNRNHEFANYITVVLTVEDVEKETRDIKSVDELNLYADTLPDNVRNDKRIRNVLNDKRLSLKAALVKTETAAQ